MPWRGPCRADKHRVAPDHRHAGGRVVCRKEPPHGGSFFVSCSVSADNRQPYSISARSLDNPGHTHRIETAMLTATVLQDFVDQELARAPAMIERTLAGTLQLLRDTKDSALRLGERSHHFDLVDGLQQHAGPYQRAFVDALRRLVAEGLQEQRGMASVEPPTAVAGLELMDESHVEVDIEISRAVQLIDTTAEWELRELQTFTSTLPGQPHVSAESNPLRPLVYATALWEAACAVSPLQVLRATLLRVSAGVTAGLLKNAWAAACTRLEAQGVQPSAYRTVLLAPGSVGGRGPTAPDSGKPGALAGLLASMPSGSAELRLGIGGVGSMAGAAAGSSVRVGAGHASPEFEQAIMRLEALLRQRPDPAVAPATAESGEPAQSGRLNLHRAALVASASAPVERQIIELLSRLFDAMLSDRLLQPSFLGVVARLQASALRVALRETDMLGTLHHPVWQLFDRVGEAGAGYPKAGDPRGTAALNCCQTLAEELALIDAPDGALYQRSVSRLDRFMAGQLKAQLIAAEASLTTLRLAERREILEQHMTRRLVDQMVPVQTTPGIRRFVTGTWAKVLAEAIVRHGEQDDRTVACIKLVDQLLWSLKLPDHPQSRQRLLSLLPGMLQCLRSGMALIAMPQAEQDAFLDELMAIHTVALRPGARGATAVSAEDIVQRMRDEVVPPTAGAMAFADSVIDLSSMETVPADMMPSETGTAGADDPAGRVEGLRAGQRLRLFIRGRWTSVQMLWRSDQSLFYVFAGETSGRNHSITRRALERLALAGLLQPLEPKPLVQRAFDLLMREQARPAR